MSGTAQGPTRPQHLNATEPEALIGFFDRLGVVVARIGLEAGPLSQWLHAGLRRAGCEVVLLETRQVKAALSAMVVKTDGVDGPRRHHRAKATAVAQSQGGHPMQISTVGIDLAKRVFQIHGVDQDGNIILRKQLRPAQVLSFFAKLPPCLVGRGSRVRSRTVPAVTEVWRRHARPCSRSRVARR